MAISDFTIKQLDEYKNLIMSLGIEPLSVNSIVIDSTMEYDQITINMVYPKIFFRPAKDGIWFSPEYIALCERIGIDSNKMAYEQTLSILDNGAVTYTESYYPSGESL